MVVTLTTVGYGDIYPSNFWSRLVFFYVVILGLGIFAASLTEVGSYLSNKRFLQSRGLHRFKLKRHVIIAGYGESTDELINRLERHDVEVVLIDENVDPAVMKTRGINLVSGNPLQAETLKKAGISGADSLVVSARPDEAAVMLSLKAKELNPKITVVASCQKFEDYPSMVAAKIDMVIPVSKLQGDLLADAVVDAKGLNFLVNLLGGTDGLRLDELTADEQTTVGRILRGRKEKPIAVNKEGRFFVDFDDSTVLQASDYVLLISPRHSEPKQVT